VEQLDAARDYSCFAGQRPCAQRSISADLIFWFLLYQEETIYVLDHGAKIGLKHGLTKGFREATLVVIKT
jgi:hypothetical protein